MLRPAILCTFSVLVTAWRYLLILLPSATSVDCGDERIDGTVVSMIDGRKFSSLFPAQTSRFSPLSTVDALSVSQTDGSLCTVLILEFETKWLLKNSKIIFKNFKESILV